jgi:hypothetical protein
VAEITGRPLGRRAYFGRKYPVKAFGLAVPNPSRNTVKKLSVLILFIVPRVPEPSDAEAMMIARQHLISDLVSMWQCIRGRSSRLTSRL